MQVNNIPYRTIWPDPEDNKTIRIIDQRHLPHEFVEEELTCLDDFVIAIKDMHVRGAGLIGATAGFGMYSAISGMEGNMDPAHISHAAEALKRARPTASNLAWAVDRQLAAILDQPVEKWPDIAFITACAIADEDAEYCRRIGEHGKKIIADICAKKNGEPVNILTHCNAGWLAFVDYGSATAPIYAAHAAGVPVHVWVDETRPWLQGANLTAWELAEEKVPHTLIADNTGGHLMQHGLVDLVIVGTDRTTYTGDVANKIGTYLKALAARDNGVPFYVALPSSTFDWELRDGVQEIPIEKRSGKEITQISGKTEEGAIGSIRIAPENTDTANYGFDVTPARLVTGLITERGITAAEEQAILTMFPEKKSSI